MIRRIVSILALTLSVTALAAIGLNAEVFGGFQRRATDALFPAAPDDPAVAVVGFDTKTIHRGLQLPVHAARSRRLVDNLKAAGARVIAFDVIYRNPMTPEPDIAVPRRDQQRRQRDPLPGAGDGPTRDGVYTDDLTRARSPTGWAATGPRRGQVHLNKDPADSISRCVPLVCLGPPTVSSCPRCRSRR